MNKIVGWKLKNLRKSRGFSLDNVMQKLNISKSTYDRMEKGETSSWITKIESICDLYQIEPEELFLSEEKFALINNKQTGSSITNNVIKLSEKTIELYEKLLDEKNKRIADLEHQLKNKKIGFLKS